MQKNIQNPEPVQGDVFEPDPLQAALRREVRAVIEKVVREEMEAALAVEPYERSEDRAGYRNGTVSRQMGTTCGQLEIEVPRARMFVRGRAGKTSEFQSQVLRRYKRRMKQVDDAILGVYLSGCNTRRIQGALRPLLRGVALSKSAVSRRVASLKEQFEAWTERSLKEEKFVHLYADAIHVKVRMAGRVCKIPVLATVGVRENGEKVLASLDLKGSESEEAWRSVLQGLSDRGLPRPVLMIVDGGKGLLGAIETVWSGVKIQRCTVHKERNLLAHAPKHAWEEIREDYNRIVYGETRAEADEAWERFEGKWSKRCPGVVKSLEEAGEQLLTFFEFPKAQWKSLRTTNVIERLNLEFRRRIKTQSSLPTEDAILLLLFGLLASGQIRMRKIDGWEEMPQVVALVPLAEAK